MRDLQQERLEDRQDAFQSGKQESIIVCIFRGVIFLRIATESGTLSVILSSADQFAVQPARIIFLVRHAEKISEQPDAPLSQKGRRQAECLAMSLADSDIGAIFVTNARRTQETAEPLSQRLHLVPNVLPAGDTAALVARLKEPRSSNVLVIGHLDTLPEIAEELGVSMDAIDPADYDRLWILPLGGRNNELARLTSLRYGGEANSTQPDSA